MTTKVLFEHGTTPFYKDLKARVNAYFDETGKSRHADTYMVVKSAFWIGSVALLWSLILFGGFDAPTSLGLAMLLGFCFAGIGFNVGHDAIHGAYSKSKRVNSLMSWAFDLMGASSYTWSLAHNYVHHTYTNIPGTDGDIEPGPFILLYPHEKPHFLHRFQHIYTWPLYCFTSLIWVFMKDWEQWFKPHPRSGKPHEWKHFPRLVAGKVAHVGLLLVAPLLLLDFPVWQIVVGFVAMHFVGGFTLAVVFQLAHVVTGPEFPQPDESGRIPGGWAEHQVRTTANFGGGNPLVTWICGGLDYQVEHHLFPRVCHTHYPALSKIVRETAAEYGLPYYENTSTVKAILSHGHALKINGTLSGESALEALTAHAPASATTERATAA